MQSIITPDVIHGVKQVQKTCLSSAITQNRMSPLIDVFQMNHRRAVPESYRGAQIFFGMNNRRQVPGSYGGHSIKLGIVCTHEKDAINIESERAT